MPKVSWMMGCCAILAVSAGAWSQVVGPAVESTALSIAPPPAPNMTAENGPLASVRANQALITSGQIGSINGEPVFVQDLLQPIDDNLRRLADKSRDLADFRRDATTLIANELETRIQNILLVSAAQAILTDQEKKGIDQYLAGQRINLISGHGGSIPAAEKVLHADGSSIDGEMTKMRRGMLIQIYFNKTISPFIVVTRRDVIDAYNKNPKQWQQEAQVELYTLTLPVSRWLRETSQTGERGQIIANPTQEQVQNAETQAMSTAREIVTKLKKGGKENDFARLVEDYDSRDAQARTGGRSPAVKRGSMVNTKLEDYVFSLPANAVGEPMLLRDPIPANSTVVVIKVGAKREARTIPFSEAQEQIEKTLRGQQQTELLSELLAKLEPGSPTKDTKGRMVDVALNAAIAQYATR